MFINSCKIYENWRLHMQATDILMEEHRVIERLLDALQGAAEAAEQGHPVRPGFFIESADFIRGFADGCHHRKEEGVLFVAMSESGVPVEGGPIGVMLAEHELGRRYTREMRAAAEQWQSGEEAARRPTAANALDYVALLRQHILKEDRMLFPMAAQAIPADRQEILAEEFERVEHEETGEGIHEKYLAQADKLTAEATALA
jgi:hemerythrin-like domain-containing protein